ncbi:hypothetical protein [Duganella sp. S19_KUP01_CR8]|uniref:hypothetical protein n=1 Tax=Duganella sp. S19_KUP01_CR8 TaxID=3025502 RepID=UPI002FCDC809
MIRIAAVIVTFMFSHSVMACSCPWVEPAGFVHATLKRLPANARGVLFLTPQGAPSSSTNARAFSITSNEETGPLTVTVSSPDMGQERPGMATQRLLRIGPAGGFKPGARYTISYVGPAGKWAHPTTIDVAIDTQPLDMKSLQYTLAIDGAPERRLLQISDGRGSCVSRQPVVSQTFHYGLPPELQPYLNGVAYFSEVRTKAGFTAITYHATACDITPFAQTAYSGGKDLIYANCEESHAAQSIRGWVGLLEVEDRLHLTKPVVVDLSKASGKACNGMGMLKEALTNHDADKAIAIACSIQYEQPFDGVFTPYKQIKPKHPTAADLPSIEALADLKKLASNEERTCIEQVVSHLKR